MRKLFVLLAVFALTLTACGGGSTSSGGDLTGDATKGEALYKQTTIGPNNAPGCVTCHSLEAGVTIVGPSHAGLGTRAGEAVSGKTAEQFIRESIVSPDAHIVEGFTAGVMYPNYAKDLSEQEVADLVAYLLTLK